MARKRKHVGETSEPHFAKRSKFSEAVFLPAAVRSHPVLDLHYVKIYSLREYLLSKLPASAKFRRRSIASLRPIHRDVDHTVDQDPYAGHNKDHEIRLTDLLDSVLVGVGVEKEPDSSRTRDFEVFSQQTNSTLTSSIGDGTVSQHEVR